MIPVVNIVNILRHSDKTLSESMQRTFRNTTFQDNKNIHSVDLSSIIKGSLIRSIPLNLNLGSTSAKFTLDNCTIEKNMFIHGTGN